MATLWVVWQVCGWFLGSLTGLWCCGVVVITIAQLHSTEPELMFCPGSNPASVFREIRDGEDL